MKSERRARRQRLRRQRERVRKTTTRRLLTQHIEKEEWQKVVQLIKQRHADDASIPCVICLDTIPVDNTEAYSVTVTSCTHLFHQHCFDAFTAYRFMSQHPTPKCPLCQTTDITCTTLFV